MSKLSTRMFARALRNRANGTELNDASPVKPTMVPTTPVKPTVISPRPIAPPQAVDSIPITPKVQMDEGYGNGVGYDGKPVVGGGLGVNQIPAQTRPIPSPIQGQQLAPGAVAPSSGPNPMLMKKGGRVKAKSKAKSSYSSGGSVKSSASKRGDGIAQRGKTKGRMI